MDRRRTARNTELITRSVEETLAFASSIKDELHPGSIICLSGDLGAGKTIFVKGVVRTMGNAAEREVSSPTFSYLHIYPGKIPIYHFDLYRLKNHEDFLALGFDEYFDKGGICCIEWPERIKIPQHALCFHISHAGGEKRKIMRIYGSN